MRRIAFGLLWFFILLIGTFIVTSVVGGILSENPTAAYDAGYSHGSKYSLLVIFGIFVVSVGGTVFSVFPGTKSKKK